jgi:hypothetical protein
MTGRNLTASEERARCLRLVQSYSNAMAKVMAKCTLMDANEIVNINGARVDAEDCYLIAQAVLKSLQAIEEKIKNHKRPSDAGAFTLDEINEAMAIMEEQDSNPFD